MNKVKKGDRIFDYYGGWYLDDDFIISNANARREDCHICINGIYSDISVKTYIHHNWEIGWHICAFSYSLEESLVSHTIYDRNVCDPNAKSLASCSIQFFIGFGHLAMYRCFLKKTAFMTTFIMQTFPIAILLLDVL